MTGMALVARVLGWPAPAPRPYVKSPHLAALEQALDAERQKREDAVALFRGAVATCPIPAIICQPTLGDTVFANGAFEANFGYTLADLRNGGWQRIIAPADLPRVNEHIADAASEGREFVSEHHYVLRSGEKVPVKVVGNPIRRDGRLLGYVARVFPWKDGG